MKLIASVALLLALTLACTSVAPTATPDATLRADIDQLQGEMEDLRQATPPPTATQMHRFGQTSAGYKAKYKTYVRMWPKFNGSDSLPWHLLKLLKRTSATALQQYNGPFSTLWGCLCAAPRPMLSYSG